jgi:hypothetical protein
MTTANGHNLESALEQLLAEQADALISGLEDFDLQLERYDIPAAHTAEANSLLQLGSLLHQTLEPISPSDDFIERLKGELVGGQPVTLMVRWRKLPAQYRLAARLGGLTITAGIMLLATRRGLNVLSALQGRGQPEQESPLPLKPAT